MVREISLKCLESSISIAPPPNRKTFRKQVKLDQSREKGTCNDSVVLHGPSDDHDGVVQRPLRLLHELLGSTADDDRASLGLRAAGEEVEAVAADLSLFKVLASTQHGIAQVGDGREDGATAGLHRSLEILVGHATGAEHVAIGEILSGHVANRQLG